MDWVEPLESALRDLTTRAVAFAPKLIAAIALLLVGWLVGRLLAATCRRLLEGLKVEEVLERAGWTEALARAGVKAAPLDILARLVFWSLLLVFVVMAAENLGLGFSAVPLRAFLQYLPRVFGAILLLVAGIVLATVAGGAVGASLARIDFDQHALLAGLVRGLVVVLTVIAVIEHLGFDLSGVAQVLTNLLTIFALAIALTFAFGGRDVAREILAGHYARERFEVGERLEVDGETGRVASIGTVHTELETDDGNVLLPNSRLLKGRVRRCEAGPQADFDGPP